MNTFISTKQLILSFTLSLLVTLFIDRLGTDHHTFSTPEDNISNISSAYLFRKVGYQIYTKPTAAFGTEYKGRHPLYPSYLLDYQFFKHPDSDVPLYIVWPEVVRPYPLGAWLWYTPYSILLFDLHFTLRQTTLVSCFVFIFVAHICFFLFLSIFRSEIPEYRTKRQTFLDNLILFLCYTHFIFWSGQGQFDLIAVIPFLFMIKSYKDKDYAKAILFYGIALLFHLKLLLLVGLTLLCLKELMSLLIDDRSYFTRTKVFFILTAALLGLHALMILYWNLGHLGNTDVYNRNNYHYSKLLNLPSLKLIYYLIVNWGIVTYFFIRKKWDIGMTLLTTNLALMTSPLIQDWYAMLFFPVFLLVQKKDALLMYRDKFLLLLSFIFLSSTYLAESPFSFKIFKVLIRLITQG